MREIIIALASGLIGSLIGGLIAIYGSVIAVRRAEYYRLRPIVRKSLERTVEKVMRHNHPWLLIERIPLNGVIEDILQVMPMCKQREFKKQWEYYRYDKGTKELTPREYQESTDIGRRLILERLHKLISKL